MAQDSLTLLKGTLDLLILKILSWGPSHGYSVSLALRRCSADAFQVEEGALYPALRRMEKRGWLSSQWRLTETGREARFYALTESGQQHLNGQMETWSRYVKAMATVLYRTEPLQVS